MARLNRDPYDASGARPGTTDCQGHPGSRPGPQLIPGPSFRSYLLQSAVEVDTRTSLACRRHSCLTLAQICTTSGCAASRSAAATWNHSTTCG